MPAVLNSEWLNQNAMRAYPFKEDMLLMPVDGGGTVIPSIRLPNYVIVDFVMVVPDVSGTHMYLSQFAMIGNLITLIMNDQAGLQVATISINTSTHVKNKAYALSGYGTYEDAAGKIVIGDLTHIKDDIADGLYNFFSGYC